MPLVSHTDSSNRPVAQRLQMLKVMATPYSFFRELLVAERCLLILVNLGAYARALPLNMNTLGPTSDWYHGMASGQLSPT